MHRAKLITAVTALALLAGPAVGQTTLFEEDFDAGIPVTWTKIKLAFQGDTWTPGFDLVNGTGDVNHEFFCDAGFFFRDNILLSPPIDLSNVTNATFQCDQFHIFPTGIDYNAIEVTTNGGASYTVLHELTSPADGFSSLSVNMDAFAGMRNVQIALHYQGIVANDWSVDNIRIVTPWTDLLNPLGGPGGDPELVGSDPLTPDTDIFLTLTNAPQSVLTYLVVGLTQENQAFKGGVLVPAPDFLFTFITSDGDGSVVVEARWPTGIPSGFETYFQFWIQDGGGPVGFLASNGVSGVTL